MLLRVIFENFLSFREPVQFDMFPNPKRTSHEHHIYSNEIPVLKMGAIYGANGSGKSNLIKGLDFIHEFISNNDFFKNNDVSAYIHKGDFDSPKSNLTSIIEFESKGKYYIYSFTLSEERIVSEALFLSGKGIKDNVFIFKRDYDILTLQSKIDAKVKEAIDSLLSKNPTVSLLQLNEQFPIITDEDVEIATNWLQNYLKIVPFNAVVVKLIDLMANNHRLLEFSKNILTEIGLGLSDINIKEELFDNWIKNKSHQHYSKILSSEVQNDTVLGVTQDNRQIFIALKNNEETIVKEFVFSHLGKNGKVFELDINGESDGTVRLLNLIPALYGAIELGQTIVIDEIDHSIHPILIFALIKLFANSNTKGQLIFTTHETFLLNQKVLLRADEVWFTEKIEGATKMYSLNDFKEHNTISLENGYINGRYGAIPYIGDVEWLF